MSDGTSPNVKSANLSVNFQDSLENASIDQLVETSLNVFIEDDGKVNILVVSQFRNDVFELTEQGRIALVSGSDEGFLRNEFIFVLILSLNFLGFFFLFVVQNLFFLRRGGFREGLRFERFFLNSGFNDWVGLDTSLELGENDAHAFIVTVVQLVSFDFHDGSFFDVVGLAGSNFDLEVFLHFLDFTINFFGVSFVPNFFYHSVQLGLGFAVEVQF